MKYARADLVAFLGNKTLETSDSQQLAREVAAYLLEQNKVYDLESVVRDVLAYREAQGIVEADVMSAHELSQETITEVHSLLKQQYPDAKKIIIHPTIDADVVGGLRIRMAHEQLDMSVRHQLDTFKRLTTEGNV